MHHSLDYDLTKEKNRTLSIQFLFLARFWNGLHSSPSNIKPKGNYFFIRFSPISGHYYIDAKPFRYPFFFLQKETVNGLPNSINIKLNYIAQFNDISDSLERYEGLVAPTDEVAELLSTFSRSLDIKSPLPGCLAQRELIFQGPLKLKDVPKSFDVYCFLFTDMLLITQLKKATKKYRIIKPPVATNRMIVKELAQTDKAFVVVSLNDYNVPDSVNMFISNFSRKWIEYLEISKVASHIS